MRTPRLPARAAAATLLAVGLALAAAGCGGDDSPPAATTASSSAASDAAPVPVADALARIDDGAVVVDVRTPEEFAAGHLAGALNIDVQADDFADRVGELDPAASYVVYCASGNRATGAVEQMRELGIDDVVNGGGYDDLVEAAG